MGDKQAAPYRTHQPSRWLRNLILLAIVAALAVLGWNWTRLREEALVGSAYGARVGCVCRYISQRPLKSCEGDLKVAGLGRVAGLVSLSDDAETKTVRAGVPLLARQSATYSAKTGCQLEPWDE
ncbi:MAG: hypothetical protein P8Y48_02685 [Novosphingobium sp.]